MPQVLIRPRNPLPSTWKKQLIDLNSSEMEDDDKTQTQKDPFRPTVRDHALQAAVSTSCCYLVTDPSLSLADQAPLAMFGSVCMSTNLGISLEIDLQCFKYCSAQNFT
jgi:hypothetical protein